MHLTSDACMPVGCDSPNVSPDATGECESSLPSLNASRTDCTPPIENDNATGTGIAQGSLIENAVMCYGVEAGA
jgi:hypothetical protein